MDRELAVKLILPRLDVMARERASSPAVAEPVTELPPRRPPPQFPRPQLQPTPSSPEPPTDKERDVLAVIQEYEVWRRGGPRPDYSPDKYNNPLLYRMVQDGSAYILPDLDKSGDRVPELILGVYPVANELRNRSLREFRLVQPAWVQHMTNPGLGERVSGELRLEPST
jgi:hypothetical protein